MMERQLIAWAILLVVLLAAAVLWQRGRRVRRAPERHLRIDLLTQEPASKEP